MIPAVFGIAGTELSADERAFFKDADPAATWVLRLHAAYPEDIGILAPLFLNLVRLAPGQAMYLTAGQLHAYLEGLGIELMANSDNVLRGGLTPKHVDVPELLQVLNFEDRDITLLASETSVENELIYPSPTAEFILSVITLKNNSVYQSPRQRNVEIIICTEGQWVETSKRKEQEQE